jgi:hypothetical protein
MIERLTTGRGIASRITSLLSSRCPTDNVDILLPAHIDPGNAALFSFSSQYQGLEKVPAYLFGGMQAIAAGFPAAHCSMHMTRQRLVYSPFAAHGVSRRVA